VKGTSQRKNI
jgi:hypothetical protein